jgi:cyanophycinase-like exopeptidase
MTRRAAAPQPGSRPRILAIIGSGETTRTLAAVHRDLFKRLGDAATGTLLDTTYGFQENADELSEKIVEYFGTSVERKLMVAGYRSRDSSPAATATAVAHIDEADFVLAGPGSPTYALRHWEGGPIADAVARKLRDGGVVVMASAAALTLGVVTMPVYEIYKVGADPEWLPGLDLLGPVLGASVAVIPHYDNSEGGTHDTRFCYVGERRLRVLEGALAPDTFILGVDGHTALVLDLDAATFRVRGTGGVTIRVDGRSRRFESGVDGPTTALCEAAADLGWRASDAPTPSPATPDIARDDDLNALEADFRSALAARDVTAAVDALVAYDAAAEPSTNDRVRFGSLLVRLGDAVSAGMTDPREVLAPFVDALLEFRTRARESGDYETADLIRRRLAAAGIEVRDGAGGSAWLLEEPART